VYKRELRILSSLDHPNLVKFLKAEVNPVTNTGMAFSAGSSEDSKGIIYMDLLSGPNFRQKFMVDKEALSEPEMLCIVSKLAEALDHMHSQGFAHRDLKPENVWFVIEEFGVANFGSFTNAGEPVLFDFGQSFVADQDKDSRTYVGSPHYMAPEVLLELGYDPYAIDVWGLGMILFAMVHGASPNGQVTEMDELEEIMSSTTKFAHSASPLLTPLLDGMLSFDVKERWTITKIREYIARVTA
jgi:serine/threonine protein kinase